MAVSTGNTMIRLVSDLSKTQLMPQVNDWFSQINGGLSTFSMSLKRNAILAETFANIILLLSKNNLSDIIYENPIKKKIKFHHDVFKCDS